MTYLYICLCILALQILARIYNPNRTWTIKKGNHYTSLFQRAMFLNWWVMTWKLNTREMVYTALFTDSCSYIIDRRDQNDWNKLTGLQYGFSNKNSVRPGWRWSTEEASTGYLYATCYRHVNGNTISDDFHRASIAHEFPANLNVEYYGGRILFLKWGYDGSKGYPYPQVKKSWPVLPLFPYFGGTRKAPHDIKINISNLVINGREV